jgi:DNA-binding response OmpR family regulator
MKERYGVNLQEKEKDQHLFLLYLKRSEFSVKSNILVVDDEPDTLQLAQMVLQEQGYSVTTASEAEKALVTAKNEIPDLVLLDVVMPGKTGLEVCKILKTQTNTEFIPVIMFTCLDRKKDQELMVEAGANGFIVKPFEPDELLTNIKGHLERSKRDIFSRQLKVKHEKLRGKKILIEFDALTPYTRFITQFVVECISHEEQVVVMTKPGSIIMDNFQDNEHVELLDAPTHPMLSTIKEEHPQGPLNIIYDSLTDLYRFTREALRLLSDNRITSIFLLNPIAHDPKEANSLRSLFNNRIYYGKEGPSQIQIS